MVRIACFIDDEFLRTAVQSALNQPTTSLNIFAASNLSDAVRQKARSVAPDLILLELAAGLSNAHIVFFLRADSVTRSIPIVVLSYAASLATYAAAFDVDAFVRLPATIEQISEAALQFMPLLPAREVGVAPTRLPLLTPS